MKTHRSLLTIVALAATTVIPSTACPRLPHDWPLFPKADRVHFTGVEYPEPDMAKRIVDPGTTTVTPDNVMHVRNRKLRGWLELALPELGIDLLKLPILYEANSDMNLADASGTLWGTVTCYLNDVPIANCIYFGERENVSDASGPRWRGTFEWMGRFSDGPLEGALLFAHETIESVLPNPPTYLGNMKGVLLVPESVDLKPHKPCERNPRRGSCSAGR